MFSEVLKLPSSHCSPLSFSKLLGKPPQEALKVNLIAPMALMQARDILGIWSFGVIGGRAGRVFIYNKPTNTARQSWATCSPSASFEIFEMVIARGRRERERGICIYIYIYISACVCVYIYIYAHTYHALHMVRYGHIWYYTYIYRWFTSYLWIRATLQIWHVHVPKGLLPQLRRAGGRVLHLGTSVAHHPQKGTATWHGEETMEVTDFGSWTVYWFMVNNC